MNIAFCFSGGVRNFEKTFSSIKKNLLDIYSPDIFICGVENKYGRVSNFEKITKLFSPVKVVINYSDFYNEQTIKHTNTLNLSKMHYNIAKCDDMRKDQEKENNKKYDYVFRLRFDTFCVKTLEQANVNLNELTDTTIMIPSEWNYTHLTPLAKSDVFAIGTSQSMTAYSSVYDNLDGYMTATINGDIPGVAGIPHPESLLGIHLDRFGITVIPIHDNIMRWNHPEESGVVLCEGDPQTTYRRSFDVI